MTREKRRRILNRILAVVAAVAIFLACRSAYVHFTSPETQPEGPDTTPAGSNDFVQTSPDKPLYVLLIGTDGENPQQANFVGVAAINKDKKHIDLIMLPDDTKIEGRKEKGIQELQDVYTEGSISLVRAVVEDIFHIPIPYYAAFTPESFAKMIDMNGGVPLYVEKNITTAMQPAKRTSTSSRATRPSTARMPRGICATSTATATCRGPSARNGSSRTSTKTGKRTSA